jgi:hypothetical protein
MHVFEPSIISALLTNFKKPPLRPYSTLYPINSHILSGYYLVKEQIVKCKYSRHYKTYYRLTYTEKKEQLRELAKVALENKRLY